MTPTDQSLPSCRFCVGECLVGYGYCHCGCGQKTERYSRNAPWAERKIGDPHLFINGHQSRRFRPDANFLGRFKIDGIYCRLIPLTQGQWAIVWESDFEWAMRWKWYAHQSKKGYGFYAVRNAEIDDGGNGNMIMMHRELVGLKYTDPEQVDHVDNFRTLENTRTNIRLADYSDNGRNRGKQKNNTSGFKCVVFHRRPKLYQAVIQVDRKVFSLVYRRTAKEASLLYEAAVLKYHGEFARVK